MQHAPLALAYAETHIKGKIKNLDQRGWGATELPQLQPRIHMWRLCGGLTYDDSAQCIRALADSVLAQCAILIGARWAVADIQIHHICDGCVNLLPALTVVSGVAYWHLSACLPEHLQQIPDNKVMYSAEVAASEHQTWLLCISSAWDVKVAH